MPNLRASPCSPVFCSLSIHFAMMFLEPWVQKYVLCCTYIYGDCELGLVFSLLFRQIIFKICHVLCSNCNYWWFICVLKWTLSTATACVLMNLFMLNVRVQWETYIFINMCVYANRHTHIYEIFQDKFSLCSSHGCPGIDFVA